MARKTDIRLRRSNVLNSVPGSANLSDGELAMNTNTGALYFKKSDNTIITAVDNTIFHIDSDTSNSGADKKVGIGTTSPAFKLSVNSGASDWPLHLKSTDNKAGVVISDDDTTGYFGVESSKAFMGLQAGIHVNNLNIDSSGNVGIGTASPTRELEVYRSSASVIAVKSDTGGLSQLALGDTADDNYAQIILDNSTNKLQIQNGGGGIVGDRGITLDSSENIGIGTSSPSHPLHVSFSDDNGVEIQSTGSHASLYVNSHTSYGQYIRFEEAGASKYWIQSTGGKLVHRPAGTTDTTKQVVFDANGNVGIGDTNPAHKLTVSTANDTTAVGIDIGSNASYNFAANSTSGYVTTFNMDNTGLEIGHNSASRNLALQTNGLDRLTIGGGGSTHVHGNLDVSGADVTITGNIIHAGDTDTYFGFHGNDLWRVVTGGSERFEISNSGFRFNENGADMDFTVESSNDANAFFIQGNTGAVGIGTSSPTEALHVVGGARFTNLVKLYTNPGSTYGISEALRIDNGGGNTDRQLQFYETLHSGVREHIIGYNTDITTDGSTGYTYTQGNYGGSSAIRFGNSGQIQFFSDAGITAASTDTFTPTEVVRFAENGDVGIGTTSPDSKLTVNVSTNSDGIELQSNETSIAKLSRTTVGSTVVPSLDGVTGRPIHIGGIVNEDVILANAGGNVGIGTTSPASPLDVISDSSALGIRVRGRSSDDIGQIDLANNGGTIRSQLQWNNSFFNIKALAAIPMIFYTNGTERMRIQSAGEVGIGTTTPDAMLEVAGGSTGIILSNAGDSSAYDQVAMTYNGYNNGTPEFIFQPKTAPGSGTVNSYFRFKSNTSGGGGSNVANVSIDGNVGIGTSSPAKKLEVDFTGNTVGARFTRSDTTGSSTIEFANSAGVKSTIGFNAGTNEFDIKHNSAVRFAVDNNGAVTFNEAFTFPTSIGSAGQVLKVPSTGSTLVWSNDAGGGSATVLTDTDGDTKIQVEESADEDVIRFDVAGTEQMQLNSTGLTVAGNLTVNGTQTVLNTSTLTVDDLSITVADGAANAQAADGAGINVAGAAANISYQYSNDRWTLNKEVFTPAGFMIGTTATDVGLIRNSSGVFDFQAQSTREISFSNVTNGEHVRIDADGKVGIGTNDPQDLLHLSADSPVLRLTNTSDSGKSTIEFWDNQSGTSQAGEVFFDDGGNLFGLQGNANGIVFKASNTFPGSELMRLTSAGRLGIGTSSPSTSLHIADAGDPTILLEDTSAANQMKIRYTASGVNWVSGVHGGVDKFKISKHTGFGTNDYFTIDSSGNVGIGTDSPSQQLEVDGYIKVPDARGLYFSNNDANDGRVKIIGSEADDYIQFNVDNSNNHLVRLNTTGLGIGTNNPTTKLDVHGIVRVEENSNTAFYGGNYVRVFNDQNYGFRNSGGTTKALISMSGNSYFDGGNVGIGTTSPQTKLDINAGNIRISNSSSTIGNLQFYRTGSNNGMEFRGYETLVTLHTIGGGVGEIARFERNTGDVGIATDSPEARLHVRGTQIVGEAGDSDTSPLFFKWVKSNTGSSGSGVWYKVADISLPSQAYSAIAFSATYVTGTNNFGNHDFVRRYENFITIVRNSGSSANDSPDTATVRGVTDDIRVYKTATGVYELQAKGDAANMKFHVEVQVFQGPNGAIVPVMSGSTTGTTSGGTAYGVATMVNGSDGLIRHSGVTNSTFFNASQGSATAPSITFEDDTNTGLYRYTGGSEDRLGIATAGGLRCNFGTHGVESFANVYTGNGSAFRNYGGTWAATTGVANNGFYFLNTANSNTVKALELSAAGALTHRSNYIQTAGSWTKQGTNGNVTISSNGNELAFSRSGTNYIDAPGASGNFAIRTGTSYATRMVISNAGKVGIGDGFGTPQSTLHVQSPSADGSGIRISRTGSSGYMQLYPAYSGIPTIMSNNAGLHLGYNSSTAGIRIHTGNKVGVNQTVPKASFQVEEYGIDTSSTTTTATTQVAIHTFPIADFRTARFTIQITNTTDSTYHSTEIIAVHDGTTANITEFGEVHTGTSVEATFDADVSSGNFRLLATPASTNSMTFKVVCHSITV